MGKTLTYSGFILSAAMVVLAFITAKTYTQLAIAVLVYPLLAYFALKLFPRNGQSTPSITIGIPASQPVKAVVPEHPQVEVADIDKRTFLKLVGAAGLSFFIFSLLGKRVEGLLFGNALQTQTAGGGLIPSDQPASPQPFEGYKITEIEDGSISYYGFTNKEGAWLIMKEDTQASSFRYVRGNTNFTVNWESRENLNYDYYYNLF